MAMGEEKLEKLLGKMRLSEEDKNRVVEVEDDDIEEMEREMRFTAVCKILSSRPVINEVFVAIMPKIWNL